MGDAGLVSRLFDVLQIPPAWRRRLKRGLAKGQSLAAILDGTPVIRSDHSGVIAALTGTDQQGARALVEDLLSIAGIATVGGRSAAEIAERFLGQVASKAAPVFGDEQRHVLDRFMAITGHPDEASKALRDLAHETRYDLGQALDLFDERANFIAAHDVGPDRLVFDAAFARDLDYYTGFTFEVRPRDRYVSGAPQAASPAVVGGGRYDRLAEALGSPVPVAAVGASIFVERIGTGGER
jgi:ATP phosphoribosyltransferase regulatory subunit